MCVVYMMYTTKDRERLVLAMGINGRLNVLSETVSLVMDTLPVPREVREDAGNWGRIADHNLINDFELAQNLGMCSHALCRLSCPAQWLFT